VEVGLGLGQPRLVSSSACVRARVLLVVPGLPAAEEEEDAHPAVAHDGIHHNDGTQHGVGRPHALGDGHHVGGPADPAAGEGGEAHPGVLGEERPKTSRAMGPPIMMPRVPATTMMRAIQPSLATLFRLTVIMRRRRASGRR
jgi:hypothetical protein